jgi:myo-inositol-hexaphosphate 3-phosphohydrolase
VAKKGYRIADFEFRISNFGLRIVINATKPQRHKGSPSLLYVTLSVAWCLGVFVAKKGYRIADVEFRISNFGLRIVINATKAQRHKGSPSLLYLTLSVAWCLGVFVAKKGYRIADFEFRISNFGLRIVINATKPQRHKGSPSLLYVTLSVAWCLGVFVAKKGYRIADLECWISNFGLWISDCELRISDIKHNVLIIN